MNLQELAFNILKNYIPINFDMLIPVWTLVLMVESKSVEDLKLYIGMTVKVELPIIVELELADLPHAKSNGSRPGHILDVEKFLACRIRNDQLANNNLVQQ